MTFTKTNHKNKTMDRHEVSEHMDALAENARMFMAATADEVGEKVAEARQRLYSAPEGVEATVIPLRENPCHVTGVTLGAL